ncbi:MAG: hypothetical protein CSA64_02305 [Arachnia propionica]|nr:MAG: hypothetical protein CSA64_02305 [Arachnia propionica]
MNQQNPNIQWRRVAPSYLILRLVSVVLNTLLFAAITFALWRFVDVNLMGSATFWWFIPGVMTVLIALQLVLVPARVRAIGYALREDDLLFKRGVLWRRLVAIPYGRLQMVDVTRGPLSQLLGLAEVKTMTASPTTDISIPGLPHAEAQELRDHLIRVAESRRAGL